MSTGLIKGSMSWVISRGPAVYDAVDVLNQTALTGYRAPFLPGFGKHGDFGRCEFDTQKVINVSGTNQ